MRNLNIEVTVGSKQKDNELFWVFMLLTVILYWYLFYIDKTIALMFFTVSIFVNYIFFVDSDRRVIKLLKDSDISNKLLLYYKKDYYFQTDYLLIKHKLRQNSIFQFILSYFRLNAIIAMVFMALHTFLKVVFFIFFEAKNISLVKKFMGNEELFTASYYEKLTKIDELFVSYISSSNIIDKIEITLAINIIAYLIINMFPLYKSLERMNKAIFVFLSDKNNEQ